MLFRVTSQHLADSAIRYALAHNQNLARLQRQISTGLRIEKPSDDPTHFAPLLAKKASVERMDVDLRNLESVRSRLNQSVSQLLSAKEALSRASQLALEGIQALPSELDTLAMEVEGILESMLQIANTTDGTHPLFAGTSNALQPFHVVERNSQGEPQQVAYRGTLDRASTVVDVGVAVDMFYSGFEVFGTTRRESTVLLGDTGALPGSGTDSARGRGSLWVQHTNTLYTGGSGLQPGTSSAADDTILGQHMLTVDGAQLTLSLDGGSAAAFTPGDTNVRVTSHAGAVVYVDTSSFVPGFSGDVSLEGQGTLSVDDGATQTALDFSANQMLVDSRTGQVTFLDTRQVHQTGTEPIEYPGTTDVFETLMELRDDLRNTRQLAPGQWQEAMQRRLGDVERVHDHLLTVIGQQSVSLENLDALQGRLETYQLEMQRAVAEVESVDATQAVLGLQNEQNCAAVHLRGRCPGHEHVDPGLPALVVGRIDSHLPHNHRQHRPLQVRVPPGFAERAYASLLLRRQLPQDVQLVGQRGGLIDGPLPRGRAGCRGPHDQIQLMAVPSQCGQDPQENLPIGGRQIRCLFGEWVEEVEDDFALRLRNLLHLNLPLKLVEKPLKELGFAIDYAKAVVLIGSTRIRVGLTIVRLLGQIERPLMRSIHDLR